MGTLKGKTLFITGASRGIGKAIGIRAAQDGANVVIVCSAVCLYATLRMIGKALQSVRQLASARRANPATQLWTPT